PLPASRFRLLACMFTQGWLLLAWFLLAVGVATRHAFAFLLGLVVLGSAAASYLWDRYCLARVEYRRTFTPRRAFYGETVTFTMEVTNRKPLPPAWPACVSWVSHC